jgi:mRNA-degrading endonuclease HigB of HigAB toxin-antitoxin module
MKNLLTTILFFVFIFTNYSQDELSNIKGVISHFDTPVQDIHILNITSNRGTISDINGRFEIDVKVNDTLLISHLEYTSKKVIVKKIDIENGILKIYIDPLTNYLETVELKNHNLSGNLLEDAKSIPVDTITKIYELQREFMKLARMPSLKSNTYEVNREKTLMNSVYLIFGGVGGSVEIPIRDKENELRRELKLKKSIPEKIIRDFGKDYFIEELNIPEDEIHLFISYCEHRQVFTCYSKGDILKILTIFNEESKNYHENKKP